MHLLITNLENGASVPMCTAMPIIAARVCILVHTVTVTATFQVGSICILTNLTGKFRHEIGAQARSFHWSLIQHRLRLHP